MKRIVLILLFLGNSQFFWGQMVNIESKRMQTDSIRFAFKGDLLFNYTNNNEEYIYSFNTGITTQFKSKDLKKIFFFLGNYSLVRSEDKDYKNSWLIHFRYNQKITNFFRVEAFIQDQSDKLLVVDSRELLGAGIRLKFISKPNFRAYFGSSYMYEVEKSELTNNKDYNNRFNSYLSATISIDDKFELINTVYFQPLFDSMSNHRVLEQFKMEVPLSEKIKFSLLFNYFYMSKTPANRSDKSSNGSVGLTLEI